MSTSCEMKVFLAPALTAGSNANGYSKILLHEHWHLSFPLVFMQFSVYTITVPPEPRHGGHWGFSLQSQGKDLRGRAEMRNVHVPGASGLKCRSNNPAAQTSGESKLAGERLSHNETLCGCFLKLPWKCWIVPELVKYSLAVIQTSEGFPVSTGRTPFFPFCSKQPLCAFPNAHLLKQMWTSPRSLPVVSD